MTDGRPHVMMKRTHRPRTKAERWYLVCGHCFSVAVPRRGELVRYTRHRQPVEVTCASCAATFGYIKPRSLMKLPRQVEAPPQLDEIDGFLRAELHRLVDVPAASPLEHRAPSLVLYPCSAEPACAGRYYFKKRLIRIYVWPGAHPAYLLSTLVHELGHAVAGYKAHHYRPWKDAFIALLADGYGLAVKRPRATWHLDFMSTRAIYDHMFRGVSSLSEVRGAASPQPEPQQLTLNL